MSAGAAPHWLGRLYVAALILHGLFVAAIVVLAVAAARDNGATANAAREGFVLSTAFFVTILFAALPSAIALLSWLLCRRRGWQPSVGHMALSISVAGVLLIYLLVVQFT